MVLLQSRRHVRAIDLAERFGVSERSIYRDIRALESAGIPIIGEPGVGYALDRSYKLPPVNFQADEALALSIAAKFASTRIGGRIGEDATRAMDKVLAVVAPTDRRRLQDVIDAVALPSPSHPVPTGEGDDWMPLLQQALTERRVVDLQYTAPRGGVSERAVEAVGLCHYSLHWHLIAWCRLRNDYRDFRLDRIRNATLTATHFARDQHAGIDDYLAGLSATENLNPVTVVFKSEVASFVGSDRYRHGFLDESQEADGVHMRFLCAQPEFLCRWLLQYTDAVLHIDDSELRTLWCELIADLTRHASTR